MRSARSPRPSFLQKPVGALFLSCLFVTLNACGGGAQVVAPRTADPLPANLESAYDNGADFVADPEILEGQWRRDWSTELDKRVQTADFIARVRVPTLRTNIDPEGMTTFRLVANVDDYVLGDAGEELELAVREDRPGFATVEGNQRRLQSTEMMLFGRYAGEGDTVVLRWHLSPASEGVRSRTEYLAERRRGIERQHQGRTIVHEN